MTEAVTSGALSLAALGRVRESAGRDGAAQASVAQALSRASADTGVGFDFLYRVASRESSLDPAAKASTSSAAGLFQFIEQTWLRLVKTYGESHGLGGFADEIARTPQGRYDVADPARKAEILNARYDAGKAAALAAELARENRGALEGALGRPVDGAELYAAHFLGAGGAARLLSSAPDASAADILPEAARANRNVFYDGARARTAGELVESFRRTIGNSPGEAPLAQGKVRTAEAFPSKTRAPAALLAAAASTPAALEGQTRKAALAPALRSDAAPADDAGNSLRALAPARALAAAPDLRDPPVRGVRSGGKGDALASPALAAVASEFGSVYGGSILSPYALVALQTLDPTRLRDRSKG